MEANVRFYDTAFLWIIKGASWLFIIHREKTRHVTFHVVVEYPAPLISSVTVSVRCKKKTCCNLQKSFKQKLRLQRCDPTWRPSRTRPVTNTHERRLVVGEGKQKRIHLSMHFHFKPWLFNQINHKNVISVFFSETEPVVVNKQVMLKQLWKTETIKQTALQYHQYVSKS